MQRNPIYERSSSPTPENAGTLSNSRTDFLGAFDDGDDEEKHYYRQLETPLPVSMKMTLLARRSAANASNHDLI